MSRLASCGLAACVVGGAAASPSAADSFTPVTMDVSAAPVARLHGPMPITVAVSAGSGILDTPTPIRIQAKLATECGGTFAFTSGRVVIDARLKPQPDPSEPYQATMRARGKPAAYGVQTLCVFLDEEGDSRQFATDTTNQVDVSRSCTAQANHYDATARALASANAALRHAHGQANRRRLQRLVAKRRASSDAARRKARAACGSGVPL